MYIVFEGIVGSGKSTQSKRLVEYLRVTPFVKGGRGDFGSEKNPQSLRDSSFTKELHQVLHVREPGSTPIAEDIRHLAQGKIWENEVMHPLTNAYLYAAARTQTLRTVVQPALESGYIVVADRCFLSSCAYQGEAQWLDIDTILSVNADVIRGILPDIVFYMDIDVETALSRTFDAVEDKWEQMGKDFFEAITRGYDKCEKLDIMKNRFIRIDASGSEEDVLRRIINQLKI